MYEANDDNIFLDGEDFNNDNKTRNYDENDYSVSTEIAHMVIEIAMIKMLEEIIYNLYIIDCMICIQKEIGIRIL